MQLGSGHYLQSCVKIQKLYSNWFRISWSRDTLFKYSFDPELVVRSFKNQVIQVFHFIKNKPSYFLVIVKQSFYVNLAVIFKNTSPVSFPWIVAIIIMISEKKAYPPIFFSLYIFRGENPYSYQAKDHWVQFFGKAALPEWVRVCVWKVWQMNLPWVYVKKKNNVKLAETVQYVVRMHVFQRTINL